MFDAIYELNYHISMKKIIYRKITTDCTKFFLLTIFTVSIIIWVLQAVNYLDIVIEDGHGFFVYFNYTLLSFPKIVSKIFPFAIFLAFSYILLKYENKNELVIFWNIGIKKIRFINFFIKFSFIFVLLSLILNSIITPFAQDKARSFIRSSDLSFFESMLKPKKFIDIINNLTIYFNEKNEAGVLKNIFLKDNNKASDYQITFAQEGKFEFRGDKKILVLLNGKTVNNKDGKISEFEFTKTDFNISRFGTKSVTHQKTQENTTLELIKCLKLLYSKDKIKFDKAKRINNCLITNLKNIYKELYIRLIKPLYITFLITVSLLFILKSKNDHTFNFYKYKTYLFGFLFIIFLEISSAFISLNLFQNLLISFLPFVFFLFLYFYILFKLRVFKI